jgi:hypothetical protein
MRSDEGSPARRACATCEQQGARKLGLHAGGRVCHARMHACMRAWARACGRLCVRACDSWVWRNLGFYFSEAMRTLWCVLLGWRGTVSNT